MAANWVKVSVIAIILVVLGVVASSTRILTTPEHASPSQQTVAPCAPLPSVNATAGVIGTIERTAQFRYLANGTKFGITWASWGAAWGPGSPYVDIITLYSPNCEAYISVYEITAPPPGQQTVNSSEIAAAFPATTNSSMSKSLSMDLPLTAGSNSATGSFTPLIVGMDYTNDSGSSSF